MLPQAKRVRERHRVCAVSDRTYAVGVWGRRSRPRNSLLWATCGGFAAARGPQVEDLGGAPRGYPALQTSHEHADCVSPVNESNGRTLMKAIVVEQPGGPAVLQIQERPIPKAQPGWVLVHVRGF